MRTSSSPDRSFEQDLASLRLPQVVLNPHQHLHATDMVVVDGLPLDTRELPARATSIASKLKEGGFPVQPARVDHGFSKILRAHHSSYLDFLIDCQNRLAATPEKCFFPGRFEIEYMQGMGRSDRIFNDSPSLDDSTPITAGTWRAAYWSAQCALNAADLLLQGQGVVYSLCRPSGHHAGRAQFGGVASEFGGFCYLNNAAIAALEMESRGHKVAILDIDAHHGNGTQAIMYERPTLVCSIHGDPAEGFFPIFSGFEHEIGSGDGEGFNCNYRLPRGAGNLRYLNALSAALEKIEEYKPEYLLVSLGLDFMSGDPYGGLAVSEEGLKMVSRLISQLRLPTLLVQEGGYSIEKLGDYVRTFLYHFESSKHSYVVPQDLGERGLA